jgi:hypothetical protein
MTRADLEKSVFYQPVGRNLEDPGKIYYKFPYIYVNEKYKGIHLINNSDPQNPVKEGFIVAPGCGIGGAYKRYFLNLGILSAGMSYTYSDIQYPHLGFHKYKEDGLTFYDYDLREVYQSFNTLTANLSVGVHSPFYNLIFVECTLGLGYVYSLYDKDKRAFNGYALGLGYRGIYPAISFKLGFNIR